MKRKLRVVSSNESLAAYRKRVEESKERKAIAFDDMDLEVLELTELLDLAVEVHFQEVLEGHKFSGYGSTLNPLLKDIARRAKKLGERFDHRPETR
jgi:hypothetical protein